MKFPDVIITTRSGLSVKIPAETYNTFSDIRRAIVLAVFKAHLKTSKTTTDAAYATMTDCNYRSDSSVYNVLRDDKTIAIRGKDAERS